MAFPTRLYGRFGDEKVSNSTKRHKFGTIMELPDGSLYRYCLVGEAIGAGQLCQGPLAIANHDMDLAIAANAAVGASTFTITLGGTAATLNQYQDGWVYINDGAGEGHKYRLESSAVTGSGGTFTCTLEQQDTVAEALTSAASLAGLMANQYNGALLYNTTPDGVPTGVAATEISNAEHGWLQTRGWGVVLAAGTQVIGKESVASLNTSGAVDPHVATGDATPGVAIASSPIAVATDYQWVYITIE